MASSSSKALNAILPQIAASPYEAHQKARTFAARYVKAGQYDVAIDVLFQSARELMKNGQAGSGTDLSSFLLEVYDQKGEPVSDESKGQRFRLICFLTRSYPEIRQNNPTHRAHWSRGNLEKDSH